MKHRILYSWLLDNIVNFYFKNLGFDKFLIKKMPKKPINNLQGKTIIIFTCPM